MKSMQHLTTKVVKEIVEKPLTIEKQCVECQKDFTLPNNVFANYINRCEPCRLVKEEREASLQSKTAADARLNQWNSICPIDYRDIDATKFPDPLKLQSVLKWEFGPRGLVLHGETGRGKTRCAWALLAREHGYSRSAAALDSMAGLDYAAKYSDSPKVVKTWLDGLIAVDVLLLDDVFKNKLTDSFEGVIFTLVDQRIQHQKPTLLTSNDTGDTLAGRMTQDRSAPLLRRLREHCESVRF